jgi:hypothetical protein
VRLIGWNWVAGWMILYGNGLLLCQHFCLSFGVGECCFGKMKFSSYCIETINILGFGYKRSKKVDSCCAAIVHKKVCKATVVGILDTVEAAQFVVFIPMLVNH